MAPESPPQQVGDVAELASLVELRDIVYFKVHADRIEEGEAGLEGDPDTGARRPQVAISVHERHDETRMQVRCVLEAETADGRYVVDAAARYETESAVTFDEDVAREFVARVGVMAVYPYIREALHSAAAKLRLEPPVLGLLRPGGVSLTEEKPE